MDLSCRMIKFWGFIFLFLVVSFCGCSNKLKEKELISVNIAFQSWVGYGPFYLAQEKGFCKEEGIELNFIDEQLDSARRDAFKQGMLDFEGGTIDLLVSKAGQDTPIVAVMEIDKSFGGDAIIVSEGINSLEDLVGKKVALARDDVGETFLSVLLYKKGLSIDRIKLIPRNSEKIAESFLNKDADACVTWEPQVSEALKRPGARILASSKEYPGIIIDTLNVRRDLLESNPGLVKGLMRAWFKAVKLYMDEPIYSSQIIAKYYKISAEEYRKQVAGLKWDSYELQKENLKYRKWIDNFDMIAQIKFSQKRIPFKPDPSKCIINSLLERLYEDSK